jgi:ribose transport system substrate-binding protein
MRRLFACWCVALALLAPACSRPADRPRVLVCPKGLVQDFWLQVKAGAEAAGRELGAEVLWKGPAKETEVAEQIAIVEDHVVQRVDAIALAACDARGLVPAVQRAVQAGIPVISIDSGLDSELPLSFVATDNVAAAREAARVLAGLVGSEGAVALMPIVAGAGTSIQREQGFREGLAAFPGLKLVAVQHSESDVATAMAKMEDMLTAHPGLAGIFAASEAGALGVARALEARGVAGKVKAVAFDASPNQIDAVRRGTLHALVVQNPWRMGHDGVRLALDAAAGRPVPRRIDTGITVVTRENLDTPAVRKALRPAE